MKLNSPTLGAAPSFLLAGWLLLPAGLHAAQMAYEGFDYPTGSLTTQNGGSGWNGAWQTVNNGSADVMTGSLVAGSSSPSDYDLRSIGNSANLPNGRRVGRFLNTSNNGPFGSRGYRDGNGHIGADGTTLYLSFVQQPNGTTSYYEFEFHRNDLGDGGRIGGIGNDQGGTNVNLRAPNGTHTFIGAGSTGVNFYVVRIDFKAGNDDVHVYQNPTSATDPGLGAATLTKLAAADMSFNGISFGAFVGGGRTVAHDEVRFGQTWADVTLPVTAAPAFTHQPEASTTAFAGGTLGLVAAANGFPEPTYQWYRGDTLLADKTSPFLTLSHLQPSDAGVYTVTATNSQGDATSSDATVVVAQPSSPGLLAYEGFDYPGPFSLEGKSGGLGWGAPWEGVDGGGGNLISGNLPAGTNAPNGYDLQSLSNSSFIPNAKRSGRMLDTSPTGRFAAAGYVDGNGNIGADGKTIYISFLQQPDGTSLFYEFEFHRDGLGDNGRRGGIGNDTGNPTVALRTGGATTVIGPGSTGVNLYVVRIDFKAGDDDVYVYQNPISATEPGTATLVKTAAADMSFDGLSMGAFVNGRTVKHDEIRVGEAWSDVIFGTSRRNLTWVGGVSSNAWNFAAANWSDGVTSTAFVDGDPVTFDDSGSDTPAVSIPATVATASLTVDNSTKNYTLGGAGTISSSGGLEKSGNGSLTLNSNATLSSAIVVDGGSLVLNGTTTAGGGLNADAGETTLAGSISLGGLVSTNGNLTITGPTTITGTGALVWIGNFPGADSSLTIEAGGSFDMSGLLGDAWVVGRDGGSGSLTQNGGVVTYNPTNRGEAYIGASTSTATTASYTIHGGTLEMSAKRLAVALGPITSQFTQSGGTVNLRQLDLGSTLPAGAGTGIYNLTGGVINLGAVGLGTSGITSGSGQYEINLSGGTLAAAADWQSPLMMGLMNTVTFDSGIHTVSLSGGLTDLDAVAAPGGLLKNGPGTLVVSGFNDYTGPTTVAAGTLAGFGNQFSALTVAAGATLAPGDGDTGTFYCAAATLASGSTLAVEIDSTLDFADQLTTFDDINLTGANLALTEIGTGTIPAGTELVIVDYSGSSRSGTFTGYPEGASVSVGSNTFTLSYVDSSRITLTSTTVENPYAIWATAHGLDGTPGKDPAFDADPEADGFSNGLEWILGGDPLAPDSGSLVSAAGSAANGLILTFTREEDSLGNATLAAQWDAGLDGSWADVPVLQSGGSYPNGVTVTVNEAASPDEVTVHVPATNAANGKLFGRLQATTP